MLSRQALRSLRAAAPQRTFARPSVRSYAAAASAQEVKPPVSVYGLDGTYATALVRHLHRRLVSPLNCIAGHIRYPWSIGDMAVAFREANLVGLTHELFSTLPPLRPRPLTRQRRL